MTKNIIKRDDCGRIVYINYSKEGVEKWHTYNAEGLLMKTRTKDVIEEFDEVTSFEYNEKGDLIREVDNDEEQYTVEYTYVYDNNGKIVERKTSTTCGAEVIEKFDSKGRVIYYKELDGVEENYTYKKGKKVLVMK